MILVTGAGGFVGTALCGQLRRQGKAVRAAIRAPMQKRVPPDGIETVAVGDLAAATGWGAALDGIDCVIHLAARTHVMRDTAADPLAEYRHINVDAAAALARAAAAARVRRFVFLSSIKVNGERTVKQPFTEDDAPHPEDAYAVSKWEAEQALWKIAAASGIEVVVLRAPLVYGPGVKGNFLTLLRAVARGTPLPFASIHNKRSLLHVGNLAAAIARCIDDPAAAGKTFLVADDEGISTPELVRAIATALDVPARLLPFPPALLRAAAALLGRGGAMARLTGSLQVDSGRIRRELGWRPECTLAQGLAQTARWYHAQVGASSSTE
ncbi:MAG TPA: NAD-dependent epimerase/dehydratase family protein [Burkholderiales bacterium]|nr:NAD-dependent epimerase/dehydratase family protein [Burkholderiales bacterium]